MDHHSPNPESPTAPGSGGSGGGASSSAGGSGVQPQTPSRYEAQKRRDWNTFGQYLRNHRPPLSLSQCSGAHVLEFLRYLDQFGKTKVHTASCPFFGHPNPPAPCPCPLRQAWGSLDALVGRLRAAFEEHGGRAEANPFGARAVRLYLRDVRDSQAKARGIAYEKKRRKRNSNPQKPKPEKKQEKPPNQEAAASEMASAAVGEIRPPELVATPYPPYYLFPHGHLFQGHYLAPASGEGSHAAAAALDGVPGGGAGAGEDIVLVMAAAAAAAEAHAAGCLMPLSVFN